MLQTKTVPTQSDEGSPYLRRFRRFATGQRAARPELTPFRPEFPTVTHKARARGIPGWKLDQHGLAAVLPASPVRGEEPIEEVTLIPMGCARLRISAFPVVGAGPQAHR